MRCVIVYKLISEIAILSRIVFVVPAAINCSEEEDAGTAGGPGPSPVVSCPVRGQVGRKLSQDGSS
jgi:hypothetical protein